ncbi:MAG: tetratricopeptide repeat protein, partial [Flavobacteriales bacterium]
QEESLEFTYRLARIHDKLGNQKDAISYYEMTINNGADSKRYFAANSSLMLGLLYEKTSETDKARTAFKACSSFNNSEYKNSIQQKAKAGILRLAD